MYSKRFEKEVFKEIGPGQCENIVPEEDRGGDAAADIPGGVLCRERYHH